MPHHVRLTLLDLTGCTLKPGLQREASEPTTAPTPPPDLSVPLPLHCTSWPAWAFPSLNFVVNCPVHGRGSLLRATALPLAPARTPAVPPQQLLVRISLMRPLLAPLGSLGLGILHSSRTPGSSSSLWPYKQCQAL